MKQLFLLFAISLISFNFIFAQKVWHNSHYRFWGNEYEVISTCGDTLIKNELWTFIERGWANVQPAPIIIDSFTSINKIGMIQEQDGLVKIWTGTNVPPKISYNYNLEVGDSIHTNAGGWMVTTEVDSIFTIEGIKTKITLKHSKHDYEDVWVEGIGSVYNSFYLPGEPIYFDAGSNFICNRTDYDPPPYTSSPSIRSCLFFYKIDFQFPCIRTPTSSTRKIVDAAFELKTFPNPFHDLINISTSTPFQKIELYDLNGKVLLEEKNISTNSLELNGSHLSSGLYFIKAIFEDGRFSRSLIIKN